jgi:phospholipase A1
MADALRKLPVLYLLIAGMILSTSTYAVNTNQHQKALTTDISQNQDVKAPATVDSANPVAERVQLEKKAASNPFTIAFYEPTYLLPYYYTGTTDARAYQNQTPLNESLKHNEMKFQFSFKVPIWRNIHNFPLSLYLGYTQMSYWQAYDKDPFFRSTDYAPELFLRDELDWHIAGNWKLNYINLGAIHQSNGRGGVLERSWNRVYTSATASTDYFMVTLKPWIIVRDSAYNRQNPDMGKFLGYGDVILGFKYHNQVVTLQTRNFIGSFGHRAGATLGWTFPLTTYLNGFVQVFSGYGQSLIEYNHRTNSVGVGIALSNWL